ncbi:MAG: magnesium/cobalt transporter CorA [Candidatus Omnitrophica bacterium]|nr:magnesium/cobalt transporter CorA [Candidatus Omnitrophota bacterium]
MYESFLYHPDRGLKTDLSAKEITEALADARSLVWIDFPDLDDADVDFLTSAFNLHPLTIEDFIMPNARPKIEKFKDYLFLIMFSLEPMNANGAGRVKTAELDCCLGKNFLITFHSSPLDTIAICKERLKRQSPIMMNGADMLLYAVLDSCVDSYFPIIQKFDSFVDEMSDELFKSATQDTLKKIYLLKNDIMYLRRTVGPQADIVSSVARGDFELISPSNVIYFRNIFDNLVRLNDIIGTSRDVITGAMETYVSLVSNRLNEVMKTLTVITTIMMPLTLIASIYGMNFKHMPELEHRMGYPGVIATMLIITSLMLYYFKRRRWL